MGCRPAAALLLLAAVGTLCFSHTAAAAEASSAMPSTSAADLTLGVTARRLLEAFDATPGTLQCSAAPYLEPLRINNPGLYRFRIQALGTHQDSAAVTSGVVLVGKPSVPLNVTYYGGIGKVTVLWESPAVDPDPTTTKYRLYATPLAAEGRRRLLDEQQTSIAALVPSKGDGSAADPFNATVYLPAGNYSFAASAWNSIGESALSPESARTAVAFSTHPRFWTVQGSPEGALLRVIRPDSVAEPDNLRFKIGILKAGDSGSGVFRAATLEEFSGNGSLADPAVFTIPLSAFGEGTQYAQARFVAFAINATGGFDNPSDASALVTVGLPPAPANLQFATASEDSVTVSWDASPTAARYEVKLLQTAPTAKVAVTAIVEDDGGDSFTKTFSNLTPGRYSVSVDPINPNGDRATAPATWGSDPLVVGAPLTPTVTAVTGGVGRLTIEWSAPAINADLDVTYTLAIYDVTPGNRNPVDVPIEDVPLTASPRVVTQLSAGTKRVQITATNANAGDGRYLAAVKSALADEADVALATAPGIPSSEGVAGSTLGANISVTAPSQMSTAVLNSFLIQAYHATEDTELGKPRQVLADPSYIAGPWNLFWSQNAPQFLRFKVAAQSEDRTVTSPWSDMSAVVTVGTPDRPTLSNSPAPVGGVSQLSLSWGAVYTAANYRVRIYRYGELVQTRTVTGTSHIERGPDDAGLLWGMYTVKVAAVNANGDAGEEAETDPLTVGLTGKPDTPTAEGGIGNMTLTWRQPAADPDPPRTVFYARIYNAAGTSVFIERVSLAGASGNGSEAATFVKTIPLPFGEYKVTIFGRNVNGDGEASEQTDVTKVELSNRPAVTAVAGFADKAVLTVLRPDILENYTALSYKVELYDKAGDAIPGAEAVVPSEVTGTGTIYNPSQLTLSLSQLTSNGAPGQFKFRVVAVGGPSDWPAVDLTPVVTVGVPSTPTITTSAGGLSSANATWSASPTSAYYLVELLYQGTVKKSARVEHSDSTPSYTYVFEKVAAGTYTIRVTAINDNNAQITAVSATAATTGNLLVGLPGQPRLDAVVGTVGRATITWRLPLFNPSSDPADTTFWLRTYLVNTSSGTWEQQGDAAAIPYDGSGPWDLPRDLYAGVYRFIMFGRNVNGDGPDSDLTDPITVAFSNAVTFGASPPAAVGARYQANLTFVAPSELCTAQVSKFRVQAIREDGLVVEEARELALASGVSPGTASLQLVFDWPSGEPQRLKFRLAATDSTFAGPWSAETNVVTVGQPAAPVIRASDGLLDSATVKFDAVQFAVSYSLRLLLCTGTQPSTCTVEAGSKPSETAAGLHTFSSIATPGLYAIEVSATAANEVVSEVATSPMLLVGKPGKVGPAAGPSVTAGVGNGTFSWEAPAVNPDATGVVDATRYTLRVYDVDGTTLLTTQALSDLNGDGSAATPFTKVVTLIAGKWKATIAASNQHGEGPESELTSEFTVGVTSKPVIDAVQGGPDGLVLSVYRPGDISAKDARYLTYLVQLYDADTGAKIGNEIRVNNSATGADGTATGGAYSFAVPYKQPQRLAVEIIADAGATRSEPSERWPLETVGTPAKPSITAVNGSASADGPHAASITFLKVYTASGYAIELADVFRTSATPVTDSLANVAHTDAGPWTRTLTVPAKGTYRFKVVASNVHGTESADALSDPVVVGLPDAPALAGTDGIVPSVGKVVLRWSAPESNSFIGTKYNALVYRSGATTTPLFNVSLAANGTTTSGTTSFEEELTLPAGPYQLEIATANVHGLGGKTAASAEFTVGISTAASIIDGSGDTSGAALQVLRPGSMSDDAVATYLIQAYSDENGNTKFGEEVRGNNSRSGADGKANASAFVFPYPYTAAAKLWFRVTVVVGGTRSGQSDLYGPIVMGTPAKPTITQALGGPNLAAQIDFPRVFTAVDYAVELTDVNNASVKVTDSLNVADTVAGPWSRTLTAPAKGTYRFKLTASNVHGARDGEAQSDPVVLGLPDAPALPGDAITAAVGKIVLKWTAPQTNGFIGTRYNALVYRSGATTTPLFNVSLAANGTTTSGTTRFEEELTLPAGPYQLEIATANVHGLGGKTAASAEFTVGISTAASIIDGSGDTSGAALQVLRPSSMSDDAVATYLIQAYSDENGNTKFGEEVRGNNSRSGADGKANASAFVFPYPYTAAARLWFRVTVVVGGTRSGQSDLYGPIVVGTPATPRLDNALGGATGATFSFTAVPTAVKYIVTASKDGTPLSPSRNETTAGQQTWTLAQLGGEPGEFTFSVVAENANSAQGEAATSGKVVVGTPGAPAWAASNPVVAAIGTTTLRWTAPAYNAKIGTRYYVQLWRDNGATKFGGLVALAPTGDGTAGAPFTATSNTTAGAWSYQVFTNNTWGPGGASPKSQPVGQPLADTPSIKNLSGGPTTATLSFLKPASATDQDTITYSAQLYDVSNSTAIKLGEPVVLSITGGSGTDADPYQASLGPFAQPLRITAAIQAKGGAGSATTALSAQSNEAVVGLPLVPLIQGLAGSKNELRVTWLKNDTTATSYKISVFKAGTFVPPVVEVPPSSLTGAGTAASPFSFAIPAANLPEAHRYAIKVAAVNANGAGPWSAMSEVAVYGVPTAPGTPTVTLVDPSVRVVFTKSDSTAVKYSAFVKPASGAEVEVPLAVKPVTGSPNQLFALVAPDAPELPQGGTYTLQVAAYNANDDVGTRSAASAAFQLGTVAPSAPRSVGVTASTPLAALVYFQAPASTGGSPITSYEVELFLDGDSTGVRPFLASALFAAGQTEGTAARPFRITFTNLAPGPWSFVVTAINKNDRTSAAATAPVTVKNVSPTRPAIASIAGADSDDSSGTITQTIRLSVLKPSAGGEVTAWSFSLWNSAKNFAFIQNRAFTPSDGDGTATDPYIATLTIPSIPDGLYTVTVAATTATGTNSSLWSPPVALGTPPAPSIVGATGSDQAVTLSIRVAQAVTVPANAAAGIRSGTTAASQPTFFTVTLRPTLGANLRAVTRRVRAQSGSGSIATPYSVAVPVTAPNEWTVQAATGSNVNGASDADDWTTPVAAGIPGTATGLTVSTNNRMANVSFVSAPWWTSTATTARVRVINCVTGADETSQASGGVLPPTTDPDNAPYLVRGSSINRWDATLRVAGNNAPTAANPIPRPGCWRLQIALINVAGGEAARSAQTDSFDVGVPHQVGAPTIAQNSVNGLAMNVRINTTRIATFNNPPSVTQYRVRVFSGPPSNSTLVRTVTFTADQARSVQTIVMPAAGTYSVAVRPVGVNGINGDSPRSNFVALVARRTAGRRLVGAAQEEPLPEGTSAEAAAAAAQPKRRSRHLL